MSLRYLDNSFAEIKPCGIDLYFHNTRSVLARGVTVEQEEHLRDRLAGHVQFFDIRPNRFPRNFEQILTVTTPDDRAMQILANQRWIGPRCAELAWDLIFSDDLAPLFYRDLFDQHFVQPRHAGWSRCHADNGTYTRERRRNRNEDKDPGHGFVWYGDCPSKHGLDPNCFHIEGRYVGQPALRQIGISSWYDMCTFDHAAFWSKHVKLYIVDLERLGIYERNRRAGSRRRKPFIEQHGKLIHNKDLSTGSILFRIYGRDRRKYRQWHSAFVRKYGREPFEHEREDFEDHLSVQNLVDQYGRGPYLREHPLQSIILSTMRSNRFVFESPSLPETTSSFSTISSNSPDHEKVNARSGSCRCKPAFSDAPNDLRRVPVREIFK
jgi:hypothetical protein